MAERLLGQIQRVGRPPPQSCNGRNPQVPIHEGVVPRGVTGLMSAPQPVTGLTTYFTRTPQPISASSGVGGGSNGMPNRSTGSAGAAIATGARVGRGLGNLIHHQLTLGLAGRQGVDRNFGLSETSLQQQHGSWGSTSTTGDDMSVSNRKPNQLRGSSQLRNGGAPYNFGIHNKYLWYCPSGARVFAHRVIEATNEEAVSSSTAPCISLENETVRESVVDFLGTLADDMIERTIKGAYTYSKHRGDDFISVDDVSKYLERQFDLTCLPRDNQLDGSSSQTELQTKASQGEAPPPQLESAPPSNLRMKHDMTRRYFTIAPKRSRLV